jgi:CRP-like cAMP-binding protein
VTNQLYDLCHRHLAAAGIELWPLSVPRPPRHDAADSRQRLLSHVDLFRALQGEEIEALSKRLSRHEYEVNQEVVKSEEVMDYLMIVESGVLSVTVKGPSGPVESARLGPGDSIGEAGVLAGLPVQAQVTALTRALIYRLDKADLTPLLKNRPEIGQQMCQLLSQQQDSLRQLNTGIPVPVGTEHTLLDWLRDGMRKLHELTT